MKKMYVNDLKIKIIGDAIFIRDQFIICVNNLNYDYHK